ncbi:MAG: hypothetical protein AMJ81_06725 [Phycisphaerae bacterium SM23_33]|nr:MAG: hypothetical protein AMJ81_06725 [Phycisphaerae bacterium SM23_33]
MDTDVYPIPTGKACKATGFEKLHVGMSFAEVVKLVGHPTRDIGSGAYILVYDIESGGSVLLSFAGGLRLQRIDGRYFKPSGEEVILSETAPVPGQATKPGEKIRELRGEAPVTDRQ